MAGWNAIQKQMQSEGISATDINLAQGYYSTTVEQLYQNGVDAQQAIAGAQQLIIAGKTVLGAVNQIATIAQSIQRGAPFPIVSTQIVGAAIGIGIAAGFVTAGAGAAIMAVVSGLFGILQGAGLFGGGGQPQGKAIRCGISLNDTVYCGSDDPASWPNRNIDCVCVWDGGKPIVPGSPNWRSFPDPNNPADADWFKGHNSFSWKGATWASTGNADQAIVAAFGAYWKLLCDAQNSHAGNIDSFLAHYFVAWKANCEYALNGVQPRQDWEILVHLVRMWNTAHSPGNVYTLSYDLAGASGPTTINDFNCANFQVPYVASLVQQIVNNNITDVLDGNGNIPIHTGPSKSFLNAANIVFGTPGGGGGPAPGMSTGAKIATGLAVAAGLGLAGAGVYAYKTHTPYLTVLQRSWQKTGGRVVGAVRRKL